MMRSYSWLRTAAVLSMFICFGCHPAQAQTTAFSFTDPASGAMSRTFTDGFRFTPTVSILVTSLGYYDRDQNGLTLNHPVAMYATATQSQLALVTAGSTATLNGLFRYVPITPLLLTAGTSYTVAGFHPGSTTEDFLAVNVSDFTAAAPLTYQGYFVNSNTALAFPASTAAIEFVGPNFRFTTVPEPGAFAMLTSAVFCTGGLLTRRRRKQL